MVSACIHPAYTAAEFETCLKKVGCAGIYIPESYKTMKYYDILSDMIPELRDSAPGQLNCEKFPFLRSVLVDSEKSLGGSINIRAIFEGGNADITQVEGDIGIDDPLTIVFTSGTTGTPKAAMISHHSFVNNALAYSYRNPVDRRNSICCPLPFFHVFGMMITLGVATVTGTKVIVPSPGYDIKDILETIEKHRCVEISGAPTMHLDILGHPDFDKYDVSSVKKVVMGGNICPTDVRKFVGGKLNAAITVGYGATETTTAACLVGDTDPEDKRLTTVGKPLPFVEAKIADVSTGKETAINEPGEVWIRGHNIFLGYHGEEAKTREVFTAARWYKTGDVGTMDEEGYVTIMGRLKDMVIRGGENIYPIEIEGVLNAHPDVQEALVLGVPDKRMGEELCAWIVPKDGCQPKGEDLQEYCKGKISHFKIPRYFIFQADYPKTAIGKAQKQEMRVLAAKKLGL
uniref:Medium-chain acyl-CoA ligase ACSF2, mitochondrial n=1 Tax=Ornithodoros turicata TaxID=34597 RepID=A0A2R5LAN1_9ACAR